MNFFAVFVCWFEWKGWRVTGEFTTPTERNGTCRRMSLPRGNEGRCRFYLNRCWDLESALAAEWLLGLVESEWAATEWQLVLALAAEVELGLSESLVGGR